jgi:DNA-binding response OmpR family regulator
MLFIDDEEEMGFMVATYFRQFGYNVLTGKDAGDALRLIGGARVQVAVLDVNLAGESGFELMRFLKKNHPDVPVILYTGMEHDDGQVKKALSEGAHQYLRKTGSLEELHKAVLSAVKG